MKKNLTVGLALLMVSAIGFAQTVNLRYSHMNPPGSVAGKQAEFFAAKVKEFSKGAVEVKVFPSSQLGNLQEQAEQVSSGVVAFHHNTMAGIGSLYKDYAVLDTPFMYRDIDHCMKVNDPNSPIMKKLEAQLLKNRGVRMLYTFYFGTRELTADRAVFKPEDMKGMKIRAIPFPIYMAAVEGMGASPMPVDFAELPTALATKVVNGQENPYNTIINSKFYETQSHLMQTNHIIGAEAVVVNAAAFDKLSPENQKAVMAAAAEASKYGTQMTKDLEASDLQGLKDKGMKVIGKAEGLDVAAFTANTKKIIDAKFPEYKEYYSIISSIK
jgi:tripartite ATP-independent transporter DctP family solute receptor